jgi:hypothetical protein
MPPTIVHETSSYGQFLPHSNVLKDEFARFEKKYYQKLISKSIYHHFSVICAKTAKSLLQIDDTILDCKD